MPVQLKVCGIVRAEDLHACIELGVDAIGLNFWAGSARHLTIERAAVLLAGIPRGSVPRIVGVFVDPSADELQRACDTLALDAVQLHGERSIADYPGICVPWIRVVRGTPALAELDVPEPAPMWTLLDAHVPGFGGAGVQTDWSWASAAVIQLAPHPVWLAGGITAENAGDAIARVAPAGIDVASGAEIGWDFGGSAPVGWKARERIAALAAICGTLGV
jgi:phosphoribosylanthranilate isomerase